MKHPLNRFGTYYLHGDGKPRRVSVLDPGDGKRVKIRDTNRGSIYWTDAENVRREAKMPAMGARPKGVAAALMAALTAKRGR